MNRMVYWRFKNGSREWHFGFMTQASGGLVRMGLWNGDFYHGPFVDPHEIETRPY